MRDWLPMWLERARETVRPRTHDSYNVILERHLLPALGQHRHGTATFLLSQGVDLKTVSAILGHSQIHITADVYAHVQHDLKRGAAARLGAAIFGS